MKSGTQAAPDGAGMNRTGMITSPLMGPEMTEGAAAATPSSPGGPEQLLLRRAEYISEGFPLGSPPPPPVSLEGVVEGAAQVVGMTTGVGTLADKLSERLAFERTGTRLYEALINKVETLGESRPGPTLAELREIRDEELRHFHLVREAVTSLGGDPTVQSPCADVAAVTSLGVLQVLTDPRTSVAQCLQAVLTAELTDNAGWELLVQLTRAAGHEEMAKGFQAALENEARHVETVRGWLAAMLTEKV
ncbi:MAG TPA: ferritin-like domain-containing protein [Pyrinomonadaceae bacterium]|nr:ferritin-like domain-containing protein [Pyrinomonadaceae bacterium]